MDSDAGFIAQSLEKQWKRFCCVKLSRPRSKEETESSLVGFSNEFSLRRRDGCECVVLILPSVHVRAMSIHRNQKKKLV